ncbi:leucyl/phenylalanyl-tRNA--protein transferase [Streptomyces sp. NPDC004031]
MTTFPDTLPAAVPAAWDHVTLGDGIGVPVAIGGDLTPDLLLAAHLRGVFCLPRCEPADIAHNAATYGPDVQAGDIPLLPSASDPYARLWWSPTTRYVLPVGEVHLGRTLRRAIRASGWTTTVDRDLDAVLDACRAARSPQWITPELTDCLRALHRAGWVRSVEVWNGSRLVGGLFGLAVGQVFVMSSAFHTEPDAAKAAIADLARRSAEGGIRLLDAQVRTDYTVRLGARGIPRREYLDWLAPSPLAPGVLSTGPTPAARLLEQT